MKSNKETNSKKIENIYLCSNCRMPITNQKSINGLYNRFSTVPQILSFLKYDIVKYQEMFIIDEVEIDIFKEATFIINKEELKIICKKCNNQIGILQKINSEKLDMKLYLGLLELESIKIRHSIIDPKYIKVIYQYKGELLEKLKSLLYLKKIVLKHISDFEKTCDDNKRELIKISETLTKSKLKNIIDILGNLEKSEDTSIKEKYNEVIGSNEEKEELIKEK